MYKLNKSNHKKDNTEFYKKALKKHGISAKGVHWNSKYTQYKRFEVLTLFLKDIESSFIVDAGCGLGEYYNYLIDSNKKPFSYLGIDCEEMMIELAQKRFVNINFKVVDILKNELVNSDYYICSGAMNLLSKDEIFIFIKKCFISSNKGFAFNFLKNDPLTKVKIEEIINYSKTLSKKVTIKDDYLQNDVSIYLEK
jgi:SAM-dependent methyltransferase